MNNRATPETAQRLKAAGFPQPEPTVGQVWYNDHKYPSVIVRNMGDEYGVGESHFIGCSLLDGTLGNEFKASMILERCFYAPTADEILRELGIMFFIQISKGRDKYACCEIESGHISPRAIEVNPAEAAALAWLDKNEK